MLELFIQYLPNILLAVATVIGASIPAYKSYKAYKLKILEMENENKKNQDLISCLDKYDKESIKLIENSTFDNDRLYLVLIKYRELLSNIYSRKYLIVYRDQLKCARRYIKICMNDIRRTSRHFLGEAGIELEGTFYLSNLINSCHSAFAELMNSLDDIIYQNGLADLNEQKWEDYKNNNVKLLTQDYYNYLISIYPQNEHFQSKILFRQIEDAINKMLQHLFEEILIIAKENKLNIDADLVKFNTYLKECYNIEFEVSI